MFGLVCLFGRCVVLPQSYNGEIGLHSKSNSSRMYFREEEKIKLFFCILLIFTRGLITLLTKLG